MSVPALRIRVVNQAPLRNEGAHVLYWMIAAHRRRYNFGLQRAVEVATALERPLLVLEALWVAYPHASDRLHAFLLQGMADNARALAVPGVGHHPYVERVPGEGRGLLEAMARDACLVVTDDFPCFFLPRMVEAAGHDLPVRLEAVDSNGLFPMRATDRAWPTAAAFRRMLQRELRTHLAEFPLPDPLEGVTLPFATLPLGVAERWPAAELSALAEPSRLLASLPIAHGVGPGSAPGGSLAGTACLQGFLDHLLARYPEDRNEPDLDATSGLSPYLHFGHVGSHEVFAELMGRAQWQVADLSPRASGQREGWWNAGAAAEAFLDQVVTWREVGFNAAVHLPRFDQYESLPDWARATLEEHASDPRPHCYSAEAFEAARTHDPLWNAAQSQLVREGRLHNYLRMLWGKKILEWSRSPREAMQLMVELNDRYALDGRDPNGYSGIAWCLGRYDRPWPERAIFGKVRCMTSDSTARKHAVGVYLRRYA